MTTVLDRVQIVAAARRRQRAIAADRRRLAAEIAGYDTPAQRDDLLETLARYPDEQAEPVRQLLRTP